MATLINFIFLALSPSDRWAAAKKFSNDSAVPSWLIWGVGIAVALLVISVISVGYRQKSRKAGHAG